MVDGSGSGYPKTVCAYVHLNLAPAWLLGQMQERTGGEHDGEERRETTVARAEGIVAEELEARGLGEEADLARRANGEAAKVAMAVRVRAESAMTVKWIAARLQMGTRGHVK